jgi:hypothetical protein
MRSTSPPSPSRPTRLRVAAERCAEPAARVALSAIASDEDTEAEPPETATAPAKRAALPARG